MRDRIVPIVKWPSHAILGVGLMVVFWTVMATVSSRHGVSAEILSFPIFAFGVLALLWVYEQWSPAMNLSELEDQQ